MITTTYTCDNCANEQAQNFREPTMLKDVPSFSSHRTTYMPERLADAELEGFRVSVCFDSVDEYTAPNYVKGHWCKGCVENLAIMRLGNETIQCVKVTSE